MSGAAMALRLPLRVAPDAEAAARLCAARLADLAAASITARGSCVLALSGGATPQRMLEHFAGQTLPWRDLRIVQVDERLAPEGDPARNLTSLEQALVQSGPLPRANLYPMPVTLALASGVTAAIVACEQTLRELAGNPPTLDIAHLGLGEDGHTASLFPGDGLPDTKDREVGFVAHAPQWPRLSLTVPALNRARHIVWLVTGTAKAARLAELIEGRGTMPAMRIAREHAEVIADAAACGAPGDRATRNDAPRHEP